MAIRQVTTLPVTELTIADGNWDASRKKIDTIVLHTMVGTVRSADTRFNNPTAKVSAHYGVGIDGKLYHWVDEDNTAYHSGDYPTNQRSIGIEHEDLGKYNDPRPDVLYRASAALVADLCKFYGIPCDASHIRRHQQISATACPDALDTDRIIREAAAILAQVPAPAPTPSFTNQTQIPLGDPWGTMELGAIRSTLNDQKRDLANTQQSLTDAQAQIHQLEGDKIQLQTDLATCRLSLVTPPISSPDLSTYSTSQLLSAVLKRLLGK